jgi:hypothetical protein
VRIERMAALANILALIPGGYCAYGTYVLLHPVDATKPLSTGSGAVPAVPPEASHLLIAFALAGALFVLAAILNGIAGFTRSHNNNRKEITKFESKVKSKLVIHSANYKAIGGGGKAYNVTEFMQQIITGDAIVLDIENHNFWLGDKNFVPKDPCSGTLKRLQVTYSYDGGEPHTIERQEHSRLVLPEDSELEKQRINSGGYRLSPLQDKLFVAARQFKKEANEFVKANPKPPYVGRSSDEVAQALTETIAWKKQFAGWYRSNFAQRLQAIYDELAARGINDSELETAFISMSNINPTQENVTLIVNSFRILAAQLED